MAGSSGNQSGSNNSGNRNSGLGGPTTQPGDRVRGGYTEDAKTIRGSGVRPAPSQNNGDGKKG